MATHARTAGFQTPRWLRRIIVTSRRSNLFPLIEILCAVALVAMGVAAFSAFTTAPGEGQLLPTRQLAFLQIGALVPAI